MCYSPFGGNNPSQIKILKISEKVGSLSPRAYERELIVFNQYCLDFFTKVRSQPDLYGLQHSLRCIAENRTWLYSLPSPVEQSSAEAKSLKLRAKGLSGCHPSGQQPGQRAKIKNYSHDNLLKEPELKAALTGSTVGQKAARQRESTTIEKGKTLTLCSKLEVAEGCDVWGDEVDDE